MNNFLFYAFAFIVALSVLIIVHEYAHFLVARLAGVKILRFSLGFGRVLWSMRLGRDRTEWALSAIPLGGYVKMLGEYDDEVPANERDRAFCQQSVARRMAIAAAGPVANLLLAVVLFWVVFFIGSEELKPIFGAPPAGTPAAHAGFEEGELALKVNGKPVQTWQDLRWDVLRLVTELNSVEIEVINTRGEINFRRLDLSAVRAEGLDADSLQKLGFVFIRPKIPPIIDKLMPDGAAARAGMLPGDEILTIDGEEITSSFVMIERISASPARSMDFSLLRGETVLSFPVTPDAVEENGKSIGRIGVLIRPSESKRKEMMTTVRYDLLPALGKAVGETYDKSLFTLKMIGKMLTGAVSWRNIGGPLTIADYAGQSARLGLDYYLKFLGLISISLGVFNLLPIPILDGGHLLYYVLEIIKRKPLSDRSIEIGQRIGIALLLMLMVCSFYNDINRLIHG
ncbi:MAG: RIP metalloprotease RseP [Candidatus Accumulibacter sp.]|jgi:regulator of sigma E protease|nr:RIP metalloprotease RseP [Accumulibacter sp.]